MPAPIAASTLAKFTTFGDLLRFLRRRLGLTQLELAIAVGYSDTQISRLEQNLRPPDIPTVEARFVEALGLEQEPDTLARLLDLAANVRREDAPAPGLCPYKGLDYYDEADAQLFVGREALTAELVDRILALSVGGDSVRERFLAVVGASGSGKSSLVRAGLVPSLRWHKTSTDWPIAVLTPTARPLASLAGALTAESDSLLATTRLIDDMAQEPRSLQVYARRSLQPGSCLLLVVDQFEELFTLCRSESERTTFLDNLLTAASEVGGVVNVVIALRADFYAHCAGYDNLRKALARQQQYIGAMNQEELRRAIEGPAERGRWELEPGLVDLLLHDVGREPGALPLLSHALLETWQRRRGRTMTLGGYTASGGVRGAIAETAETVFTDQLTSQEQAIARRIFLRLTELGDETESADTRRRAAFSELILNLEEATATHAVLKALADARLITTSENAAEVAHEALIREWPTLRGWLEENRADLRLHRHLTEAAQEWQSLARPPDMLWRGARLGQASEWAAAYAEEMNVEEREFLAASIEARDREAQEREARRQRELETMRQLADAERQRAEEQVRTAGQLRRRALILTGALAAAVMMALAAIIFWNQSRQATATARASESIAISRELAAAAVSSLDIDPERSILLALRAIESSAGDNSFPVAPEAVAALHQAVLASRVRRSWQAHEGAIRDVAYSPDGKLLASAGQDGLARLWEVESGRELLALGVEGDGEIGSLAFSPDGARLATSNEAGRPHVWDVATGEMVLTLSGHDRPVGAIAFSLDGSRLLTGSDDTTAIVWDAASGEALQTLAHGAPVVKVAFSPQEAGALSATAPAFDEARIKVWNNTGGQPVLQVEGSKSLALSPDGQYLAAGWLTGRTVNIWEITTGAQRTRLIGHTDTVRNVAFSPDGTRLATAGRDQTVRLWQAADGAELLTLLGHAAPVVGVAFSPDGAYLATGDEAGVLRIWDAGPDRELFSVTGPNLPLQNVLRQYRQPAFGPDGSRLYTIVNLSQTGLGTISLVLILDAASGREIGRLGYKDGMYGDTVALSFALDREGRRLAVGYEDGQVRIGDTSTDARTLTLSTHAPVLGLAFSPDGQWLATPGPGGTVQIWDTSTGSVAFNLEGHSGLVLDLAFSPDGQRLATAGDDHSVRMWELASRETLFTLTGDEVLALSLSPDGARLATGNQNGSAHVWDAADGRQILTLSGHAGAVTDLAFSPDGDRLATSSGDGTLKIWDTASGRTLLTLPSSGGVAFSPDGRLLASAAGADSSVNVYLLDTEELTALARSRLTRELTAAECQEFLHLEQCPATS